MVEQEGHDAEGDGGASRGREGQEEGVQLVVPGQGQADRAPATQAWCRSAGTGSPSASKPSWLNLAKAWLSRAMTA